MPKLGGELDLILQEDIQRRVGNDAASGTDLGCQGCDPPN